MTIAKKLWLLIFGVSVVIGLLTASLLFSEKTLLMQERQAGVRQAVEVGYSVVSHFQGLVAKGEMTDDQAKRTVIAAVKSLRYSNSEYLFITDMQPRMVMHPIKPDLDGTDLAATADTDGKHMFVEMVDAVKATGAGYVGYNWPKPGSSSPVPKVSYVKGFAPWVGSSVPACTLRRSMRFS